MSKTPRSVSVTSEMEPRGFLYLVTGTTMFYYFESARYLVQIQHRIMQRITITMAKVIGSINYLSGSFVVIDATSSFSINFGGAGIS